MGLSYRLVYDITEESPSPFFTCIGVVLIVAGALAWALLRDRRAKMGSAVFLAVAILWTVVASVAVFGSHYRAVSALKRGDVKVVEGVVHDFHAMPYEGHDTERLTVGGVAFAYSDFIIDSGFNKTSSHGGPMREGLPVRIHYRGDPPAILKLEIGN